MMDELIPLFESFLSGTATVLSALESYRTKRTQQRIQQVQDYIQKEVANLGECFRRLQDQPESACLFAATLKSLIEDDEEEKTGYYAAFLDHMLTETTDRAVLRRVAECFRSLSSMELSVLAIMKESGKIPQIQEDWIKVSLPTRLQSLGMYINPSTNVYKTRFTSVGLIARTIAIEGKCAIVSETED